MAPWRCIKRCARASARPPSFSGAKSTRSATSSTTCRSDSARGSRRSCGVPLRRATCRRRRGSSRISPSAWGTNIPAPPAAAQDPDGARGGRAHGPAHPPDAPGFQIRERDPHARRSQEYRLYRRSRRAKTGPGHAGHPTMDLSWRTLRVCGQSAPTRVGAARPRRAAEHPPAPRGTEAKTHDLIERPRHTNTRRGGLGLWPRVRPDSPTGRPSGRGAWPYGPA